MKKYKLFRNSWIGLTAASIIFVSLLGSCKTAPSGEINTPDPTVTMPKDDPTLSSSPSLTSSLTPSSSLMATPIPSPTPSATPEIILSAKGDICNLRYKDPEPISADDLDGKITLAYIKTDDGYVVDLVERASKGEVCDYATTKGLYTMNGDKFIPTDVMKSFGNTELLDFDNLYPFMTETLEMDSERAQAEIDKIKDSRDLIEWYVTIVPKNEQIVIPWADLVQFISTDNYDEKLEEQARVLEKYWMDNNILV